MRRTGPFEGSGPISLKKSGQSPPQPPQPPPPPSALSLAQSWPLSPIELPPQPLVLPGETVTGQGVTRTDMAKATKAAPNAPAASQPCPYPPSVKTDHPQNERGTDPAGARHLILGRWPHPAAGFQAEFLLIAGQCGLIGGVVERGGAAFDMQDLAAKQAPRKSPDGPGDRPDAGARPDPPAARGRGCPCSPPPDTGSGGIP